MTDSNSMSTAQGLAPRTRTFDVASGVRLVADECGPSSGDYVCLLHGGGQSRGAWRATQQAMARRGVRSLAIDARGHGESTHVGDYRIARYVEDLEQVVRQMQGRPSFVGASLGGLTSLALLGEHRAEGSALVLVDVVHRFESAGAERISGFMLAYPEGFASLDQAADAIAKYLPDRKRPRNLEGLRRNLVQDANGRWRWRWDVRFLAGGPECAFDHDEPRLRAALTHLTVPTLLIRGSKSEIVSEEAAAEFATLCPHASIKVLQGASHMVAGDDNDAFLNSLLDFILPQMALEADA